MRKTKNNIISFALAVVILLAALPFAALPAKAITFHSQEEAVEWIKARGNEAWWDDVDGAYGCQCVDLVMAYYQYLVGYRVGGNGKDYCTNALPSGWYRDNTPAPGCIAAWPANVNMGGSWTSGGYGHVGLVYAVSGSTVYTVETNINVGDHSGERGYSNAKFLERNAQNAVYIHPDFNNSYSDITAGTYYLRNKSTGTYMTAAGTGEESNISVAAANGSDLQKFTVSGGTSNVITISGGSLRVNPYYDNSFTAGVNVCLAPSGWEARNDQHWGFEAVSGGYIIRNMRDSNLVLDVSGSNVQISNKSGASSQIWELIVPQHDHDNRPASTNSENSWLWPVLTSWNMSRGYYDDHVGIDILPGSESDTPVLASKSGTVLEVFEGCKNHNGAGAYGQGCDTIGCPDRRYYNYNGRNFCNYGIGRGVIIAHDDGTVSQYGHMDSVNVSSGQRVSMGQELGYMGSRGASTGKHLHFEIRRGYESWKSYWSCTPVNNNPYGNEYYIRGSWNGIDGIHYTRSFAPLKVFLDVNALLDGVEKGNLGKYGTFDVYINGSKVANDVTDYYIQHDSGSVYEIKDIRPKDGIHFLGAIDSSCFGKLDNNTDVLLSFETVDSAKYKLNNTPAIETYNGHTYYYYSKSTTWYNAHEIAKSVGGHLAAISNAAEGDFVHKLAGRGNVWMGATDRDNEGVWTWVTGEKFVYTNWDSGEPSNSPQEREGREEYAHIQTNGKWNDAPSCKSLPFVVEIDRVYTVKYNLNSDAADGAPAAQVKPVGKGIILSSSIPTLSGHTFIGWSTSQFGSLRYRPGDVYSADSNVVLYPVWQKNSSPIDPKPEVKLGDVNGDGNIDALDYAMVKRHVLGTYTLTEDQIPAADINGDGNVDALDYAMVKRHVLGTFTIE